MGSLGAARRSFEFKAATDPESKTSVASTSPQCFPQFYSPARDSHRRRSVDGRVGDAATTTRELAAMRRRSVDGRVSDMEEAARDAATTARELVAMRRRSVDDSRPGESLDLQAVRQQWKSNSPSATMSSSDSFSSSSDAHSPSSRPSDASSAVSCTSSRDPIGDTSGSHAVVVVGFDANAKEGSVAATIWWALSNVITKGGTLVLVGVMGTVRGPLGYKVQVNDQTWLGANKKLLDAEIKAKNLAWSMGQFQKRCGDAGVALVVDVKAAPRADVAIVQEATARGAAHVVLDKSLGNRRRRYYAERLACAVTRMRRSGGVDPIRDTAWDTILPSSSPTSVLAGPRRPPPAPSEARQSFSSSNLRRHSTIDEEELFCIDHNFLTRRVEMLLEPEIVLADHRRHDQLIVSMDDGYESDDLFSLAGDGASRRPSVVVFGMESARNSMAA